MSLNDKNKYLAIQKNIAFFLQKGWIRLLILGFIFLLLRMSGAARGASKAQPHVPHDYVGCAEYESYLKYAQTFADTFLRAAVDHWGPIKTPLFVQMLSIKTHQPPLKSEDPRWQMGYAAADYVYASRGSNLSRETYMLPALVELSRITDNPKYKQAVVNYLKFYFKNCPSPTTHIWPWGEHMNYNVVTDRIHHWREEPELSPAPWDLFWQIDSSAVRKEIEGFYKYHTYDKQNTFLFDRHANYYTGLFDDMRVRGAYIKHSGIYLYGFTFLWTKTRKPMYLKWMKKEADLFWNLRNPKTGLIPEEGKEKEGVVSYGIPALAYYLLISYRLAPSQKYLLKYADSYVRSLLKYVYNPQSGTYLALVHLTTGTPASRGKLGVWGDFGRAAYLGKTAVLLYKETRDPFFLKHARQLAKMIENTPFSSGTTTGAMGQTIHFFLDMYDLTGEGEYLRFSRKVASTAIDSLFDDGLFKHSFVSYVYNAGCPNDGDHTGHLFGMLLRLYQTEQRVPLHWRAPRVWTRLGQSVRVEAFGTRKWKDLQLLYVFGDAQKEKALKPVRKSGRKAVFEIPLEAKQQGLVRFHFRLKEDHRWSDSADWAGMDTIIVRSEKAVPVLSHIEFPGVVPGTEPIPVSFNVSCPAEIKQISLFYQRTGESVEEKLATQSLESGQRVSVSIPAKNSCFSGWTDFWLEAWGNPVFPVSSHTKNFRVVSSQKSEQILSAEPKKWQSLDFSALQIQMKVKSLRKTTLSVEKIAIPPVKSQKGLPGKGMMFYKFQTSKKDWPFQSASITVPIPSRWLELFVGPTLRFYHWQVDRWMPASSKLSADEKQITANLPSPGFYTISGLPCQMWRWPASDALLVSPAVGDLDGDGKLEVVFASRDFGQFLTALHADGTEYWTIEKEGGFSFPVLADLDGDSRPEVIVGDMDGYLYVFNGDGHLKWRYFANNGIKTPAVGDINGDGQPEIVFGLKNGDVVAISNTGKLLWQTPTIPPEKHKVIALANQAFGGHSPVEKTIPALADLDGDGKLEILIAGRDSLLWALDNTGKPLWKVALIGRCDYGPAVGDLDGDGKKEVVLNSRRGQKKAKVYAVSAEGKILWSVPCDAYGDWSVSLADVNDDGKLEVVANDTTPALNVINADGKIIQRIPLESWNTMTPAVTDLNGDGKPDFVVGGNKERKVHVIDNSGKLLWSFQPPSFAYVGAKVKGGGNVAIVDVDGDGKLDILFGDDESWFYDLRTQAACKPFEIRINQYHNNAAHTGVFK